MLNESELRNKNGHRNGLRFTPMAWKRAHTHEHVSRGELFVLSYGKKNALRLELQHRCTAASATQFLICCWTANLHWAKHPGSKKWNAFMKQRRVYLACFTSTSWSILTDKKWKSKSSRTSKAASSSPRLAISLRSPWKCSVAAQMLCLSLQPAAALMCL